VRLDWDEGGYYNGHPPSRSVRKGDCTGDSVHVVRIWRGKCDAKMKNGLGQNVNAGLKPLAQYVEAISTSSIHRLRAGHWRDESVSTDFHELRQDFNPPIRG